MSFLSLTEVISVVENFSESLVPTEMVDGQIADDFRPLYSSAMQESASVLPVPPAEEAVVMAPVLDEDIALFSDQAVALEETPVLEREEKEESKQTEESSYVWAALAPLTVSSTGDTQQEEGVAEREEGHTENARDPLVDALQHTETDGAAEKKTLLVEEEPNSRVLEERVIMYAQDEVALKVGREAVFSEKEGDQGLPEALEALLELKPESESVSGRVLSVYSQKAEDHDGEERLFVPPQGQQLLPESREVPFFRMDPVVTHIVDRMEIPSSEIFLANAHEDALTVSLWEDHFPHHLVDRMVGLSQRGVQDISFQVEPADLGPIHVRIDINQEQARVVLMSGIAAVRDLLSQEQQLLKDGFKEQGLDTQLFVLDPNNDTSRHPTFMQQHAFYEEAQTRNTLQEPERGGEKVQEAGSLRDNLRVDYFV
jgi:hypothetical protein